MSEYGPKFDRTVRRWVMLENEHDSRHPDQDRCGRVGVCAFLFEANKLEREIIEALEAWRKNDPQRIRPEL